MPTEDAGGTRGRRVAATLSLVAGVLFAATYLYFSVRARFAVPYVDDWSLLASLQQPDWLAALFQPHNEHIMAVPRLLVWTDFWIWGWPGYATYTAAILSHALVVAVFVWLLRGYPALESRLLIGLVLVTTCTTYALQGAVFPSAVNFTLVFGFGALAIGAVAWSTTERNPARWALFALIPAALAMLSVSNGLVIPVVLAALSLLLRLPRMVTIAFVGLALAGATARYALGGVPTTALAASPQAVVTFTLAILAGPVGSVSPPLAIATGAAIVLLGLLAVWRFVRAPSKGPVETFVAGTVTFVVLSAAMTAVGRAQFDPSVAAESRYAELASLAWAALLFHVIRPGTIGRGSGRVMIGLLLLVALLALPAQLLVGRVWAAKADHLRIAALTLTTQVPDADWMWRLHPSGSPMIDPALPLLQQRDVAFLRFPERGLLVSGGGAPLCEGDAEAHDAVDATEGLRIHARLEESGSALRIVDRESRAVGLAWPAPSVSDPRAGPNDFVWAELDILTGHLDPSGRWLGLSARGAGEPYAAHLLDDDGAIVCTRPVACCTPEPGRAARAEMIVRGSIAEGRVDQADCEAVAGWVWDPVRPDASLEVRVAVDNGIEVVVPASVPRDDLVAAGKGNGEHGFHVPTELLRLGAGTSRITVSVAATGVALAGSPKTVTCPP